MKVAYGHTVAADHDPLLEKFERAGNMIAEAGESGGNIIDFFPFRQSFSNRFSISFTDESLSKTVRHLPLWLPSWVPGVAVKRHAFQTRDLMREIMDSPIESLKEKKVNISCIDDVTAMR